MFDPIPLFPGLPGGPVVLIVLVVVLLFGANKLPKLARASGQAIGEFERGREDVESETRDAAADPVEDAEPTARERAAE